MLLISQGKILDIRKMRCLYNNLSNIQFNLYIKYYYDESLEGADETGAVAAAPAPIPPIKL